MPNFQAKLLNQLQYPYKDEDFIFSWIAKSKYESLLHVRYKNEEFFIKQIEREKNTLVKGDKLAKPSRVKILQKALISYEKATKAKPTYTNVYTSKRQDEKSSEFLKNLDFFANDFKDFSQNYEKIKIEIGFGSGRHLLHMAKENPNILHIGIEIHKPSIEQVIKQCQLQEINNIIIIDFDGRILLEFFESNSIHTIFVHFPIPWDKKPHRRVISEEFVNQALRVLEENGALELRTDSDLFFNYSFEVMMSSLHVNLEIYKNKNIEISSKYEDRWKKMGKNIYDIILKKSEQSPKKELPQILSFPFLVEKNNFIEETILEDNWFVHFEENYIIDDKNFLWRIAFGDTAHVEHCYVFVSNQKACYFPKNLYSTKSNLLAHKIICERLINE